MSNMLKIDTGIISSTADTIKAQNDSLYATLQQSESTVKSLASEWQGEAANTTIQAYSSFATKYFSQYHDMLNAYYKFLKDTAGEGYSETEKTVTRKADEI